MRQDLRNPIELLDEFHAVGVVVAGLDDRSCIAGARGRPVRVMMRRQTRRQRAEERDQPEGRDGTWGGSASHAPIINGPGPAGNETDRHELHPPPGSVSRSNAASNAASDGGKSSARTKSQASRAPNSRSIAVSSHSTESGPS